jgi:TolB-like protein
MVSEQDRVPLPTEVSPLETEADLRPSHCRQPETAGDERLTVGQRLSGRYRIERELGEGGMGVVYLVTDEQVVGETFAVKVLKEGLEPEALSLLREEVRKTRKLSHPNIVDVHSVNVDGTRLYVLMEYLEGKSLIALLDEDFGRGMPFGRAWPIIEDVGAALGYAHDHNVIHSDLKPANIFLTTSGKTKLLDFGIARGSRGPLLHRRAGPLALTPAYASCEMLQGAEADARDDIYSFACVIYEMLSGKRPFGELNALEAREAGAQVPPIGILLREQNAALAQALALDREGRTGSVEELLAGLDAGQKPRARSVAVAGGTIIATLAAVALTYLALDRLWIARHSVAVQSVAPDVRPAAPDAAAATVAFKPPTHSIAVLPFVNLSGDPGQEYFSDGLTEELLNSLAAIEGMQVAARTSSFSFREHPDIVTVAHKLNVASVLEGSVRRSGNTIRVTAQLINAVTGFHLWSKTYDRNLGDVLKLQTEIATAVAEALKVTLLSDVVAKIEIGGTRNPAAFDAYLRGRKNSEREETKSLQDSIAAFTEAIRLDPNYALAFAGRSVAYSEYAADFATGTAIREHYDKALADAHQALALAPELADGHQALATYFETGALDFARANEEYERARSLAPGNAHVLRGSGMLAVYLGHSEPGLGALRRAVVLDPLNPQSHSALSHGLYFAHQYREAVATATHVISLDSDYQSAPGHRGLAYYALGELAHARASCEAKPAFWVSQWCLAVTYGKLGRHAEAEAMLAKMKATIGDASAYQYATIYAQWGDAPKALEWLDTALRLRDPGLEYLKTDPLLDPLRKEPRFQAIERELKFPRAW